MTYSGNWTLTQEAQAQAIGWPISAPPAATPYISPMMSTTDLSANMVVTLNTVRVNASSAWYGARASFALPPGRTYWELKFDNIGSYPNSAMAGVSTINGTLSGYAGADAYGVSYYASNGYQYRNSGTAWATGGATWTTNDIIGHAYDSAQQTISFYKNNVYQFTAYNVGGNLFPMVGLYDTGTSTQVTLRFAKEEMAYTPPSGYNVINSFGYNAGTFTAQLGIFTTSPGAYACYTLDGSTPTSSSPVYGGLKFANTMAGGGNCYTYWKFSNAASRTIQAGDYIEYDVQILTAAAINSGGMDIDFTDATSARSFLGTDINGTGPIHVPNISVGPIVSRKFSLTPVVGKTVAAVDLVNESDTAGTYSAIYKNIRITDGAGTTRLQIYSEGSPQFNVNNYSNLCSGQSLTVNTITLAGGTQVRAIAYNPNSTVVTGEVNKFFRF